MKSKRMRYLDCLVARNEQRPPHPSKRCDWLKFCRRCGADISHSARGVRVCASCVSEESRVYDTIDKETPRNTAKRRES
jgi:hypothetical protein